MKETFCPAAETFRRSVRFKREWFVSWKNDYEE